MTPEAALKERRENRLEVASIVLPFLGSRENDFSPFQYLLSNLSPHGAKILIPRWLALRERLNPGEVIDFHAPFLSPERATPGGRRPGPDGRRSRTPRPAACISSARPRPRTRFSFQWTPKACMLI